MSFLMVGVSGFFGAMARYWIYLAFSSEGQQKFPVLTLFINWAGCFFLGIVMSFADRGVPAHRVLVLIGAVGFLGSFTTFSAFGYELYELIDNRNFSHAVLYAGLSLVGGVLLVWLGSTSVSGLMK